MDATAAKLQIDVMKIYNSESEMAKFGKRITQDEVKEQLKVMKQKRLSRMNILDDKEAGNPPVEKTVDTNKNRDDISKSKHIHKTVIRGSDEVKVLSTFNTNNVSNKIVLEEFNSGNQLPQTSPAESVGENDSCSNSKLKPEQRKTIYFKENEAVPLDLNRSCKKDIFANNSPKLPPKNIRDIKKTSFETRKESSAVPAGETYVNKAVSCKSKFSSEHESSDRVFKKFLLNWNNLNDILKNNSDVDMDELTDLKNSLEDTSSFIAGYRENLEKLEQIKVPAMAGRRKIDDMKCQLEKLKPQIKQFKGLKKDSGYLQLSNKLSNIFLEIHKVPDSSIVSSEKEDILSEVNSSVKDLETRVKKNQSFLDSILNEQVSCLRNIHCKRSSVQ